MTPDESGSEFDPREHRVELVSVDVGSSGSEEGTVRVRLRAGRMEKEVRRSGPAEMARLHQRVAGATLEALDELVSDLPRLELASVDRVLGGGFDVLLVVVRAPDIADRPLAGAIPVVEADAPYATAAATLDAVNRIVGR